MRTAECSKRWHTSSGESDLHVFYMECGRKRYGVPHDDEERDAKKGAGIKTTILDIRGNPRLGSKTNFDQGWKHVSLTPIFG